MMGGRMKRALAVLTALLAPLLSQRVTRAEGVIMNAIEIRGSMGSIYGELRVPEAEGRLPLVIMSHGFGGTHSGHQDYADFFNARGLATYSFDYCGGGFGSRSDGTMLEMSVLTEAEDLNAVVDHFLRDDHFDRIMLWGASQGGFVSAYVAAHRPGDVAALMLEYPAFVLQDDARARAAADGSFPETDSVMGIRIGRRYSVDAVSFDIYDVIGGYTGDVLILHGDRDGIVPLSYSQRASKVYDHAELVVMPGQDHGFMGSARAEAMRREAEFLLAH